MSLSDLAPSPSALATFPFALDSSVQGPFSAALVPSPLSALAPSASALSSSYLAPSSPSSVNPSQDTPPPGAGRRTEYSWDS